MLITNLKSKFFGITLLSLFIIMFAQITYASNNKSDSDLSWGILGLGPGSLNHGTIGDTENNDKVVNGLSGIISGSYCFSNQNLLLTIRSASVTGVAVFDNIAESAVDVSPMIGIIKKGRWVYISLSGGVGYVYGSYRGDLIATSGGWISSDEYEEKTHHTIGIPVQAELFFTPFKRFGFGVVGYANFNSQRPFWGASFCIQFGNLY